METFLFTHKLQATIKFSVYTTNENYNAIINSSMYNKLNIDFQDEIGDYHRLTLNVYSLLEKQIKSYDGNIKFLCFHRKMFLNPDLLDLGANKQEID